MSMSSRSQKQLQEALAEFAMQLLCNDIEFQQWWMKNVTEPSLKSPDHSISYNTLQDFNQMLEKKLRA